MPALPAPAADEPASSPVLTAAEVVAAVRVHADRVHDRVLRLGCGARDAADVVVATGLEVVDGAASASVTSVDAAVGTWFARAVEAGRAVAGARPPALHGDEHQQRLSEALDDLPPGEAEALLLRDGYDLPAAAVGAALGTDADGALEEVARARLAYLALLDDELPPGPPSHATDLAALARLAEGRPLTARDATARRHVLSCSACRAATDDQSRVHHLLAGLAVVPLPDAARADLLARVQARAGERLPDAVARRDDGPVEGLVGAAPARLSPLLAVLSLVLAALAGTGLGLLTSGRGDPAPVAGADGTLPAGLVLASPAASPAPPPSPPTVEEQPPETDVVVVPAPPLPRPSPPPPPPPPPPSPSPTPTPVAVPAALALTPAGGPNGTTVAVTGTGFAPGAEVSVAYLGLSGEPVSPPVTAVADDAGSFAVDVVAQDPAAEPGPHEVVATAGDVSVRAVFTADP